MTALNFPNAPAIGDTYPNPPVTGTPTYQWNGTEWLSKFALGKPYVPLDGSQPMTGLLTLSGDPVNPLHAVTKQYIDTTVHAAPFDAMAYNGMQVNGGVEVSQTLQGVGVTSGSGYFADCWLVNKTGSMGINAFMNINPFFPGYARSMGMTVTTAQAALGANDFAVVSQRIEGWRIARLAWGTLNAQPITIGFWSAHHRPGVYSGVISNAANTRSCAFTYNQNVADAPEWKVVTIPGCTDGVWQSDNQTGMFVFFAVACGATYMAPTAFNWLAGNYLAGPGQVNAVAALTDYSRWTGVIVLPGLAAPLAARAPFIMRPFDQELLTCQRYFEKSYEYATAPGTVDQNGQTMIDLRSTANFNIVAFNVTYKVRKRASATFLTYSAVTGASGVMADGSNSVDIPQNTVYPNSAQVTAYATLAVPSPVAQIKFHWTADARL